ncbi:MAG: orotidine-5'-phosphate decarboxylase [Pseudomonadota bacterium]
MSEVVSPQSKRLIVALDVPSFSEMNAIVEALGSRVNHYKIGHQLFTAEGPRTIARLKELGKQVFLDLKLHEIPNSVSSAVISAGRHGVDMLTLHASGGSDMMTAAVEASSRFAGMKIIALTVVTGLSDADLATIGVSDGCEAQVARLGKLAQSCGCHGLVSSPREVTMLRKLLGSSILLVTPGVRPSGAEHNDQARVDTPSGALRAGASYIVVGRPVVAAEQPEQAVDEIVAEMEASVA